VDIQKYIASGILEEYALGLTSKEENLEIEGLLAEYPQLRQELNSIEEGLELLAAAESTPPPPELKQQILNQLPPKGPQAVDQQPTPTPKANTANLAPSSPFHWMMQLPWLLSLGLSMGLGLSACMYFTQKADKEELLGRLEEQKNQQTGLTKDVDSLNALLLACEEERNILSQPALERLELPGTEGHPDKRATIFWNPQAQQTYLLAGQLPKLPDNQSYQLWAIVKGKPVDLGVLPNEAKKGSILPMKSVLQPQAFAITIEPKGGSASPTLEAMVTMAPVG